MHEAQDQSMKEGGPDWEDMHDGLSDGLSDGLLDGLSDAQIDAQEDPGDEGLDEGWVNPDSADPELSEAEEQAPDVVNELDGLDGDFADLPPDVPDCPGAVCGADGNCDGALLDVGEECDDGNLVSWDGCKECQIVEFQVNEVTAGAQTAGSVAALPGGGFVPVWTESHMDGSVAVRARVYGADGWPASAEFSPGPVVTFEELQPSACAFQDGTFAIAWVASGKGIMARRYLPDGSPAADAFKVNAYESNLVNRPYAACALYGDLLTTWTSAGQDSSEDGVFMRRFDKSDIGGAETQLNTWTPGGQFESSLGVFPDGSFVGAWTSMNQDGDIEGVFGQMFDAFDQRVGPEFQANTTWVNFQSDQRVASFPDGGFVFLWQSEKQDGGLGGVFGQIFAPDGSKSGLEFQANTFFKDCQDHPMIAPFPDGRFAATWRSYGQDGDGWSVVTRVFLKDATKDGGEIVVNKYTSKDQWHPRISGWPDGSFIVLWTSFGQDGSSFGVYGQRFNPDRSRRYR